MEIISGRVSPKAIQSGNTTLTEAIVGQDGYLAFAPNGIVGALPRGTRWTVFRSVPKNNPAVTLVGTFNGLPAALEGLGEVASIADIELYYPVKLNDEWIHRHGALKSGPYVAVKPNPSRVQFPTNSGPKYTTSGAVVASIDTGDLSAPGLPSGLMGSGPAASNLHQTPSTIREPNAGEQSSGSDASHAVSDSLLAQLLNQHADLAVNKELAEQIIRAATGTVLESSTGPEAIHTIQQAQWKQEKAERAQQLSASAALNDEMVNVLQRWNTLSKTAVWFLIGTTIFAALGVAATLILVGLGKLNGGEVALITFVLAVFAASPAALLLLERPLKGVDTYAGGGKS